MPRIVKLDQHTANLIAAGEVIERAASVVKELVENSIDAGASIINISLTDSGLTEIIVSDNGCGMDPADAKMCVEPHATSKIRDGKDLFRISTLGFRGEALPSIVSVSNFKIKTSVDGNKGMLLSFKAGEFISEAMIASPKGTEIIVKNLFFNTPARLQNLQSQSIELSYIVEYVNKIALSKPNIAFKLSNNNKMIIQTFGTNRLLEVIANTYGDEVAKNMIEIFENDGYFKVTGYISKPSVTRATKNHVNIIVNNRIIRNSKVVNVITEAYNDTLLIGRYPICVINIAVDPSLVDVNIHPAKLEVRFSNEEELLRLIKHAVEYSISQTDLMVNIERRTKVTADNSEEEYESDEEIDEQYPESKPIKSYQNVNEKTNNRNFNPFEETNERIEKPIIEQKTKEYAEDDIFPYHPEKIDSKNINTSPQNYQQEKLNTEDIDSLYKYHQERKDESHKYHSSIEEKVDQLKGKVDILKEKIDILKDKNSIDPFLEDDFQEGTDKVIQYKNQIKLDQTANKELYEQQRYSLINDDLTTDPKQSQNKLPKLYYIGQLHGTYLLFQDEDNFYLVDQHAAYERINYEKISREMQKENIISYDILIPIKFNFTSSESILINEKIIELKNMGIIIEDFGRGTYVVREVPIWLPKGHEREFIEEIITAVMNNRKVEKFQFLDSLAKSLACKKSIKANQYLDVTAAEILIDDLGKCINPFNCPHGRPVLIKFASSEIEKWFKRIV